jgi:hypothetical protein
MNPNIDFLNSRIREFIRRYEINRLVKSSLLFFAVTLLTFVVLAVLEYYSFFSIPVRTAIFYGYIIVFFVAFLLFIAYPLLKIMGFGKQLSKEQVANIVGKHFHEIDDKLLNIIQLEQQLSEGNYKSYQLLLTAIDTKIDTIRPFAFIKAIPVQQTLKWIKWAIIPLLLFILIFSVKSEVFTESTARIVKYEQYFEKPAPYSFNITNEHLSSFQNEDFVLNVNIQGEEVPNEVYVSFFNRRYKCSKISNTEFSYTFSKLQKNIPFQIVTDEVASREYILQVFPKPLIISFVMQLNYPSYLNRNSELVENNGDATVPEGTIITWKFYTRDTDTLTFIIPEKTTLLCPNNNQCQWSCASKHSFNYAVTTKNTFYTGKDTMKHSITVMPDLYPEIMVEEQQDSVIASRVYFKGNIKDDYGFSSLHFVYSKYNENNTLLESEKTVDININKSVNIQDFYYYFDAGTLTMEPGFKIDYYFEVRDNDAINGLKKTRSNVFTYKMKTVEEINKELELSGMKSKDGYQDVMQQAKQLMKNIDELNKQMLQQSNVSWQDKQKMESLIEKYQELKSSLEQLKQEQKRQENIENQFKNLPEDFLEKQQELQKRMDDLLTEEMKSTIEKMQKMMEKMDKEQMKKAMENMKTSTEEINKQVDQQLQLFKQLEFEKKNNEIVENARKMSEKAEQLSKQTLQNVLPKEELMNKQQQLQQEFKQLKEDIKVLNELNKSLEEPNKMTNTEELQKKIEQNLKQGQEQLGKNKREKSAESQKEGSENLEELAQQMEKDMLDNQEENLSEDIESIRQLLDNLVQLSFMQESNMLKTKTTGTRSSAVLSEIMRNQVSIEEHTQMIDDSLTALARRQAQVKPFILKEVTKIRDYLEQTKRNLTDRKPQVAATNQQFVLTSMNNLSLMLAESMKEMKKSLSECQNCKKSGKGSCNKPGGKGSKSGNSKKMKSARELQQQLNRQMEALKRSMEQQGKQQGGQQNNENMQMSEQLAKMAAQQEAIRKMMQEMQGELKSQNGVGDKRIEQMIKDMEQTEKELVNRIISQQTLNRQKNIETRLLESEKADLQREKEEKRESKEGKDMQNPNPPKNWKIDEKNEKQNEMLKSVPLNLNYYYKEKVNQYFFNIE